MQEFQVTLKLNTGTMKKINKTEPGTARKYESVLELEPKLPDNLSQICNRTWNRQII